MRVAPNGPSIRNEANRFAQLALSQGKDWGIGPEAKLAKGIEVQLQDHPHDLFGGLSEPAHHEVDRLVSFTALEKGSNENIQVMVNYEFMHDGSLRREVHEHAWSGNVVEDTVVDQGDKVTAHHHTDGLSAASRGFLEEWNISY